MFLGIPAINWFVGIFFLILGCSICLIPIILIGYCYVSVKNSINQCWKFNSQTRSKYIHIVKRLWRFRFSYYFLKAGSESKRKRTIRLEYTEGWE